MTSLNATVKTDPHISGKHGFEITYDDGDVVEIPIFESGYVYTTIEDATQAADDATSVAMRWRASEDEESG